MSVTWPGRQTVPTSSMAHPKLLPRLVQGPEQVLLGEPHWADK